NDQQVGEEDQDDLLRPAGAGLEEAHHQHDQQRRRQAPAGERPRHPEVREPPRRLRLDAAGRRGLGAHTRSAWRPRPPRTPCGRNSRTSTAIPKTIAVVNGVCSAGSVTWKKISRPARMKPPRTAPLRLPRPPITAAMNPLRSGVKP